MAANLDNKCIMDIDYEGTALGVYVIETIVSEPTSDDFGKEVEFPRSNSKFDGVVFFGLDTTTFPDGIIPPVRYGTFDEPRSTDTKNAYMHSDTFPTDKPFGNYPILLQNDSSCTRCELQAGAKSVGPFKVGVVSVPGNTESEPIDNFTCPGPSDKPVQYGTELPIHRGVE